MRESWLAGALLRAKATHFSKQWCGAFRRSRRLIDLLLLLQEDAQNLKLLTEGVHSREALEVVKDHVKNVMGPAAIAYSNTVLKMSKLQAAQV